MKMELIEGSETSGISIVTPRNCPKENILRTGHGESLKSRRMILSCPLTCTRSVLWHHIPTVIRKSYLITDVFQLIILTTLTLENSNNTLPYDGD